MYNLNELINLGYAIDPNQEIQSTHLYKIPEEVKQNISSKSFWEYFAGMLDANGFFGFGSFKYSRPFVKKKPYLELSLYVPKQHLSLLLYIYKNLERIFQKNGIDTSEYINNKYFMIWDEYWVDTQYQTKLGYHRLAISSKPLMSILLKNLSGLTHTKKLNHDLGILSNQLNITFESGMTKEEWKDNNSWYMGYFDMKGSINLLELPNKNPKFQSKTTKVLNINIYGYDDLLVINLFHSIFKGNIKQDYLESKIKERNLTACLQLIKAIDINTFKEYSQICPSLVDHSLKLALIDDYFHRFKSKENTTIFFRNWDQTENLSEYYRLK